MTLRGQNNNKNDGRKISKVFLASGFAQIMVLLNGIILTITAFIVFSYYTNNIAVQGFKQTSQEAGNALIDGISNAEDVMRLISGILFLSENTDRGYITQQIRRNVPGLSYFEQIIWLYEGKPGSWQYKTIYDSSKKSKDDFHLLPNKELISRLVKENFFESADLHAVSDFDGMEYKPIASKIQMISRPFALLKTVEAENSNSGIVIGITRANLLFDQKLVSENDQVSSLIVREEGSGRRLFYLDRDQDAKSAQADYQQEYKFPVADKNWQILMEFPKGSNVKMMENVPYIILFFGILLTSVGTLFIRNNHRQSLRLSSVNQALEQKNMELQSEVLERERLNKVLAVSEKDNRAIIDSVSDAIFELDIGGNILFLSAAWKNITGFDVDRFKDQNLFSMLYPDDQEKQRNDFQLLIKGQKQSYRSFTRLRISDGTFRAVELAMSMIRQNDNKELRVVGTITDVEERRRAERALAEAEKKYRAIVENAAGGIYQLTPEGMYLSANPAMSRILGYASPEELLRLVKNANGLVYFDVEEREGFVKTLIAQGQVFGYETQVLTKDGSKIWVRENIRVVKDEQNNVLFFEGSMEDITKRKEADIALMEAKVQSDIASRAKTEFIANMSHELRTPLNAIIGFSDVMKNEVMGPLGQDIYKEYVEDINKSGQGLLKIINEILDISKIESGKRELSEREFSLHDTLKSCLELYTSRSREKDLVLIDEATDMPHIIGEELSIKQVIGNIYSNAIKYTPSGGRITLFTNFDSDGTFRLSITDTGVGMSTAEIKKALSPFGQIDNALDREGAGTGLGLPLSLALMKIHGGSIEVLSEKHIGTTVTLVFPPERVVRAEASQKVT